MTRLILYDLQLLEDPIFIPIQQLEKNTETNKPEEFSEIERNMKLGKEGSLRIEKAKDGKPRVCTDKNYKSSP
jgi:hypothetical protein